MPSVVLVHGYSETSLGAYQQLPELLNLAGFDTIYLSAFDSLDDLVTIDDLARALELRVASLENAGFVVRDSAFVCHSTGALITRRWILNRRQAAANPSVAQIPSRLVTLAGANHGSSLAELGKTPLGYLQKMLSKHVLAVGKQVLTDLDYGSDFLRRLNGEWMTAWNDPQYSLAEQVLSFSLGGDFIGNNAAMKLFWGCSESGSDNTVRMSGANLNYTILEADPDSSPPSISARVLVKPAAHLILPGYSHFDTDTGILHAPDANDSAFRALLAALQTPPAQYDALAQAWQTSNDAWLAGQPTAYPALVTSGYTAPANVSRNAAANATVVFNLSNESGGAIGDCMIAFWDEACFTAGADPRAVNFVPPPFETPEEQAARQALLADALNASLSSGDAILANSPIHNDVATGSYSFYLNHPTWVGDGTRHHAVYIEAVSESQYIQYKPTIYRPSQDVDRLIYRNQFTYVNVTLNRDPDQEFAMYKWSSALDPAARSGAVWRPFPSLPGQVP